MNRRSLTIIPNAALSFGIYDEHRKVCLKSSLVDTCISFDGLPTSMIRILVTIQNTPYYIRRHSS